MNKYGIAESVVVIDGKTKRPVTVDLVKKVGVLTQDQTQAEKDAILALCREDNAKESETSRERKLNEGRRIVASTEVDANVRDMLSERGIACHHTRYDHVATIFKATVVQDGMEFYVTVSITR